MSIPLREPSIHTVLEEHAIHAKEVLSLKISESNSSANRFTLHEYFLSKYKWQLIMYICYKDPLTITVLKFTHFA